MSEVGDGAWIFVSHSHRDLEKVRKIRNYLEEKGHNPLLFYLKCLTDDDARLPELIRDEIKSRNWFVLCDGPNARNSRYVPEEIALVESLGDKTKETIDLNQDLEPQLYKLDRLLKRATVFLSYSFRDEATAKQISAVLKRYDYRVSTPLQTIAGERWDSPIRAATDEAVRTGFVLVLLSRASLNSRFLNSEIDYALEIASKSGKSNVIPVIIDELQIDELPWHLKQIPCFYLTPSTFTESVEELIQILKTIEMS